MLGILVFNLAILVVLDLISRGQLLCTKAKQDHVLSAGFGVLLVGLVGFGRVVARESGAHGIGQMGFTTPIILAVYLVAMHTLYRYEKRQIAEFMSEAA